MFEDYWFSLGDTMGDTTHGENEVSLEKLQLPTFDGEWLNWPIFKGLFDSLVHNNRNISKISKLQRLKTRLSGEAAHLLENVSMSDDGYDGVWKDLVDWYENLYLLLFRYMGSVLECAPATRSSAAELNHIVSISKKVF